MGSWRYNAYDHNWEIHDGHIDAETQLAAALALSKRGLLAVSITEADGKLLSVDRKLQRMRELRDELHNRSRGFAIHRPVTDQVPSDDSIPNKVPNAGVGSSE